MRERVIQYLKMHPGILNAFWHLMSALLKLYSLVLPIKDKTVIFACFGGRKFDDSPKALYDSMCKSEYFKDWNFIWAFVNPDDFYIPRGEKVKIDTLSFFKALLSSKVWISNSGMARGINIHRRGIVEVETWHGTPLKKIGGEEHQNSMAPDRNKKKKKIDGTTIRCAQSEYDRNIFARIFAAQKEAILLCDLPRNDCLLKYTQDDNNRIRDVLGITQDKRVILYTPTYREYLLDDNNNTFIAPPMDLSKWRERLGNEYVVLFRAHYAVKKAMGIKTDGFVYDVTDYPNLNDLYSISDLMISDYSSTFFDYSILDRPMLCFAYDLEEYEKKRGLYLSLEHELPCPIDKNEDQIIERILNLDFDQYKEKTRCFHAKYAPYAGKACDAVIKRIIERL